MNTATTQETAAIAASTELITLPPAQRAAVALDSSKIEGELRALVAKSASITAVLDAAGREQAHRAAMDLKNTRVAITNTGKKAREDATAFSNAVIAEEKRLIAISSPEETRLFALRDGWDKKIEDERQAKLQAERARVQAITDSIAALRRMETEAARCRTAAEIKALVDNLEAHSITDAIYQERKGEAELVKAEVLTALQALHSDRVEAEAAELRAKQEREAEAARIAEERAALARQHAEAERIANEQAAEAKRLADLAAAQEAEARRQREAAEANLRAAAEAQAAELERQRIAQERVAAETKRQLEVQAPQIAAERKAIEEQRAAAERDRLQTAAEQMLADAREPVALVPGALLDAATDTGPTDAEIIDALAERFDMDALQVVDRLAQIDFVAVRAALV